MKKSFPKLNITLEVADDTIMVRETSTSMLIKAKTFPVAEVMDKYKHLVKVYDQKEAIALK
jgi:hypothetical protein